MAEREAQTAELNQERGGGGGGEQVTAPIGTAAGNLVIRRMTEITVTEFARQLAADPATAIDAAHTAGQLVGVIGRMSAAAHQQALQPALRRLQQRPLTAVRRAALADIFHATPDGFDVTLMLVLAVRFRLRRIGLQAGEGRFWETIGLRRSWAVLEALPDAHTEGNADLEALIRNQGGEGGGAGGYYSSRERKIGWTYDPATANTNDNSGFANPGDPLYDKNEFDAGIRHEVGHSIDARVGGSNYCRTPEGGSWVRYQLDVDALLNDVAGHTNLMAAKAMYPGTEAEALVNALLAYARTGDEAALQLAEATHLPPATASSQLPSSSAAVAGADASTVGPRLDEPRQTMRDLTGTRDAFFQAYRQTAGLLRAARADARNGGAWEPSRDGGTAKISDRVFFYDDGYKEWSSYAAAARARKVSAYQFRSTFEWFAEAYAAYYDPSGPHRGAVLEERDPQTKAWFDANVHGVNRSR